MDTCSIEKKTSSNKYGSGNAFFPNYHVIKVIKLINIMLWKGIEFYFQVEFNIFKIRNKFKDMYVFFYEDMIMGLFTNIIYIDIDLIMYQSPKII